MRNYTLVSLIVVALVVLGTAALFAFGSSQVAPSAVPSTTAGQLVGTVVAPTSTLPHNAAPTAITLGATEVGNTSANLKGAVDASGLPTTYWFEYSSDPLLGAVLLRSTPQVSVSTTSGRTLVEAHAGGLSGSTTYYFRVNAQNRQGVVRGERFSFTTK
jgi:phosphodiesterase/alkaline phosphatase D-like protein